MPVILVNFDNVAEIQEKLKKFMHCDTGLIGNRLCSKVNVQISSSVKS